MSVFDTRSRVPMIFISSQSEPIDMIMAMNMGADDYIVKPFDLSVLTAKIGALVRRPMIIRNIRKDWHSEMHF